MKKNKKKTAAVAAPRVEQSRGEATLEMDAIMQAASDSTEEIGIILEGQMIKNGDADADVDVVVTETADASQGAESAAEEATPIVEIMSDDEIPIELISDGTAVTDGTAVSDGTNGTDSSAATDGTATADTETEPVLSEEHPEPAPTEAVPATEAAEADADEEKAPSAEASAAEDTAAPSEASDGEEKPHLVSRETITGEDRAEAEVGYQKLGLYLHVPFCKSKCAYCDFYSTDQIRCDGRKIPEEMKRYTNAIINHMRILSERTTQYNVDTVFIGGGTPTALPEKLLLSIVRAVGDCFYLEDGYEFTVEMNPATANEKTLKKLRKHGVNRLSIGLQSANNQELAVLSRIHSVDDFVESFQLARDAGFDNINVDVMYGTPDQTKDSFLETLAFVASMKPEHISMYNLRVEDGTPFGEKKHLLPFPDEDTECDMYFEGIAYLASRGYGQYEISNFARDGYECRHNLRYWHGEEYLGCGPAAHSYFGGTRFSLKRSLANYSKALEVKGKSIPASLLDENYKIDKKEEIAEYLMLRLRLSEGISASDFKSRFGGDFDAVFGKKLAPYIERGFMTHEGDRYAFTPQGMFVSNFILSRIIPFEPKFKRI